MLVFIKWKHVTLLNYLASVERQNELDCVLKFFHDSYNHQN